MRGKNVYSRSLQTDFEVIRSMNPKPKYQDANGNSKCHKSRQALLKPNEDKTDKGRQER